VHGPLPTKVEWEQTPDNLRKQRMPTFLRESNAHEAVEEADIPASKELRPRPSPPDSREAVHLIA